MTRTKTEGADSLSNDPLKAKTKEISKELPIINFDKKAPSRSIRLKREHYDQAITFFCWWDVVKVSDHDEVWF